jgi:hypothetical protein
VTATITILDSRRPRPEQACRCVQHQLWDLADRLRESRNACAGELLVPQAAHERVIDDALTTIAAAVRTREDAIR